MTPHELYLEASRRGLRIEPAGNKLAVFPKGRCPPDFAEELRQHKVELLDWLNRPPCPGWRAVPPADLPMNPTRPSMATAAARRVMSFVVRQLNGTDPLCEWSLRREVAYWSKFGWSHEDCALAAARDVACWQLNRTDVDVIELLRGFDEVTKTAQGLKRHQGGTEAEWLHVASQVLAGEWDDADGSTRESLIVGLRSNPHPTCCRALAIVQAMRPSHRSPPPARHRPAGP